VDKGRKNERKEKKKKATETRKTSAGSSLNIPALAFIKAA
jgi:hypothetical protein